MTKLLYSLLLLPVLALVSPASHAVTGQISGKGGMCLTLPNGNTQNGTIIQVHECHPGWSNQRFEFTGSRIKIKGHCLSVSNRGDERELVVVWDCNDSSRADFWRESTYQGYTLFNLNDHHPETDYCLDMQWGSTSPGTPVWVYTCNRSDAQRWLVEFYSGPVVGKGGKCLTTPSYANGSDLKMTECQGWWSQRFHVSKHRIRMKSPSGNMYDNNLCVDIESASDAWGTPIQLWSCVAVSQQAWNLTDRGEVVSQKNGLCMDVKRGSTANDTPVQTWDCNQTQAQGWFVGNVHSNFPTASGDDGSQLTAFNGAMHALLRNCSGMIRFKDPNTNLWIVAMKNPRPYLVTRRSGDTFTNAAKSTGRNGSGHRVVINGMWFNRGNPFGDAQGDIVVHERTINDNPQRYEGFYAYYANSRDACGGAWAIGPANGDQGGRLLRRWHVQYAMGGARPIIIDGRKFGRADEGLVNDYGGAGLTFETYDEKWGGKPVMALRSDGVVLLAVTDHRHDECRTVGCKGVTLRSIRDSLAALGFQNAILWDGHTSSTLVVNEAVHVQPTNIPFGPSKDKEIPYGTGFIVYGDVH
ncbi:MAG: ricin-type beta-trefoil lectin domain protein [Gammaproteobacteria bacterium]|nr:ricin-type beta-trefoil lectin domain protein [Gammaproteobacteria bacterium]